jgi:hypothetical protein
MKVVGDEVVFVIFDSESWQNYQEIKCSIYSRKV